MAPPPLEKPLDIWSIDGETLVLKDRDQEIAAATPAGLEMEIPGPVTYAAAQKAAQGYAGYRYHPFPRCFVCGPQRVAGDGLCIFPGKVADSQKVAAPWIPGADLSTGGETIEPEYVWAALDCAGAFAAGIGPEKTLVLGQFTGAVKQPPKFGEHCVVMGWLIGIDGRKHYSGTAVYNARGELCGLGRAVWIELKKP